MLAWAAKTGRECTARSDGKFAIRQQRPERAILALLGGGHAPQFKRQQVWAPLFFWKASAAMRGQQTPANLTGMNSLLTVSNLVQNSRHTLARSLSLSRNFARDA